MSLINQMLKDIDERQGAPSSDAALRAGLVGKSRVEPRFSGSLVRIGLGIGSILIVGLVFYRGGLPAQIRPAADRPLALSPSVNPPPPSTPIVEVSEPTPPVVTPSFESPRSPATVAALPRVRREPPVEAPAKPPKSELVESVSKVVTPQHQSENLYHDAAVLIRQGRNEDAQSLLEKALSIYSGNHDARLVLARLLIDTRKISEAKNILLQGLQVDPQRTQFHMSLAHAYMQAGDIESALGIMQKGLRAAGESPDYQAFLAALLQRQSQHEQAIQHYVNALRKMPDSANWLVGLAISLQAQQQPVGAMEAYQRAIDLGLSPQLAQFAQERLRQLTR